MSAGFPSARPDRPSATIVVDLLIAQRHVVLELLDADAAVDVPRRHLTGRDAVLDGPRPRPRLLKVMSDIGAIEPGSWHDWHFAWKIGATSFENVTCPDCAEDCTRESEHRAENAGGRRFRMNSSTCTTGSFRLLLIIAVG